MSLATDVEPIADTGGALGLQTTEGGLHPETRVKLWVVVQLLTGRRLTRFAFTNPGKAINAAQLGYMLLDANARLILSKASGAVLKEREAAIKPLCDTLAQRSDVIL